jgi:carboxymethylenebutenolidase
MSSQTHPFQGPGFLSFNSHAPRIWITSSSSHAPEKLLLAWKEEGFEANYLPYTPRDQASYISALKNLHNNLEFGEMYALVCYGEAASLVLKTSTKPMPKLCSIIAFYPTVLPTPKQKYPSLLQVQVHVAGLSQVSPRPEMCDWKLYRYEKSKTGFADPSAKEYSEVDANLAWSRSLGTVRKAFKKDVDLEPIAQAAWNAKYEDDVPERGSMAVVQNMTQNSPHLTILPTLQGGIGRKKLVEFYREFFIPSLVEDFDIRLVSRTIGVDRVVDEMVVSFTHSDEVDWILPGVAPTNKYVEIAVVSIVSVRGGKLASEHMYWDQASVLVQIGLLDPKIVPKKFKNGGLKQLPVIGAEAARQVLGPQQERYNDLLKKHGLMDGMNGASGVNGS